MVSLCFIREAAQAIAEMTRILRSGGWLVVPVWLGSATFDSGVALSRDTGQSTHRIANLGPVG